MPNALPPTTGRDLTNAWAPARPVDQSSGGASAQSAAPKPAHFFVNPDYQFNPALGLVVVQFHDASGNVVNSIPNQRQLDAYKAQQEAVIASKPSLPDNQSHDVQAPSG